MKIGLMSTFGTRHTAWQDAAAAETEPAPKGLFETLTDAQKARLRAMPSGIPEADGREGEGAGPKSP